jgi:hypothetical protein
MRGLQNCRHNGGTVLVILLADAKTTRVCKIRAAPPGRDVPAVKLGALNVSHYTRATGRGDPAQIGDIAVETDF